MGAEKEIVSYQIVICTNGANKDDAFKSVNYCDSEYVIKQKLQTIKA